MRPMSSHIGPLLISVRARHDQQCHVVLILIVDNHHRINRAHYEVNSRGKIKEKKKRALVSTPGIYTHVAPILFLVPQDIE